VNVVNDVTTDEYAWVSFPAKERWKTTIILTVFLVLFFITIYFAFKSMLIMVISIIILTVSVWQYYTPRWYKLDANGVEVRTFFVKRAKPWDYFHSYYYDKRGVQLSTFSYPSRLDPFRGVSLMFGLNNRDEIIEFISRYLEKAERLKKPDIKKK